MKKFQNFIGESETTIFSYDSARKWFERIKEESEIQKWVGLIKDDNSFKEYKKTIRKVLYKYKDNLYPKELEYIREMLLDFPLEK